MATRTLTRNRFLADVLITAVEGGIGYWVQVDRWGPAQWDHDAAPERTATLMVAWADEPPRAGVDVPEVPELPVPLDVDLIARGINAMLAADCDVDPDLQRILRFDNRENEAGDIDAEVADCVVQFGLFGRIVYG